MHNDYSDITNLIAAKPDWHDQNGVPRWGEHHPSKSPDIYADEVVLLEIGCQGCDTRFKVQMTWGSMNLINMSLEMIETYNSAGEVGQDRLKHRLAYWIELGHIHYGDPPNTGCCAAGPTMNCEDYRVLEYWRRVNFEWVRMPEFEVLLPDGEEVRAL